MQKAYKIDPNIGCFGTGILFMIDQLFGEASVAAAMLCGPVDACKTGVVETSLPAGIVFTASGPVI